MSQTDRELLSEAAEQIKQLELEIGRLMEPPYTITTVVKQLEGDRVMIADGRVVGVPNPDLFDPELAKQDGFIKKIQKLRKLFRAAKPGDLLLMNQMGSPVEVIDVPLAGGTVTVKRVFEGDMMEIEGGLSGAAALIFKGQVSECVKPGDTVQLDRTGQVALKVIPKDNTSFAVETSTGVGWSDIGGQEEAKLALREAVEGPINHAALFKLYGKRPLKGVLLSGPPGCGKTLLAKATANAIREAHGKGESETAFIYVKGPEVLSMWVGNTESVIRGLFARAKEHHATYGYPAVIFIDEADAILGKRGSNHGSVLSSTIVPTFLAEMDGMADSGAFILLATNRQDILDPAIVREGRIDRKVRVDRPKLKDAAQILRIHLSKTKVAEDADELAGIAAAELFSDAHRLYKVFLKGKEAQVFHVRHLVSGAMLAGVVDMATSIAIARDAATTKQKASGLGKADMVGAVEQIVRANRNLNHEEAITLFAEQYDAEIEAVQRLAA